MIRRVINNIIGAALLLAAPVVGLACTEDTTEPDVMVSITSDSEGVTIDGTGTSAEVVLVPTGSDATLNIASTGDWQIVGEEEDTWCEIIQTATGVTVSAREFISDYTHSTMLRVVSAGKSVGFIKVSQQGTEVVSLDISMDEVVFDERGGDIVVDITTNKDVWNVTFDDPNAKGWLTVTEGEGSFTLTAITNVIPTEFATTLTVWTGTEDNNTTVSLPVKLLPWTEGYVSFYDDPKELRTRRIIISQGGGEIRVPVYSNREWEATSEDSWLIFTAERDTLVINSGLSEEGREAIITLTTTSGKDAGITTDAVAIQVVNPFTLEVTIPEDGIFMNAPVSGIVNAYIEWGDGSHPTSVDGEINAALQPKHSYDKGVYEIKIYGEVQQIYCRNTNRVYITKIVSYGDIGVTDFRYVFAGTSIKEIPDGYKEFFKGAKSLYYAFADTPIEAIPADLIDGLSVDMTAAFMGCSSLKEIPATFFEGANVSNLMSTFRECSSLTEIPETLFDPLTRVSSVLSCFADCTGLTHIPDGLFGTCTGLSDITSLFRGCRNITTVEPGFLSEHTNVELARGVFEGCGKLQTIGTDFLSKSNRVRTVETAFAGCTSLTGESPFCYVDSEKVHFYERPNYPEIFVDSYEAPLYDPETGKVVVDKDGDVVWQEQTFILPQLYEGCFSGCTGLSDYDSFPDEWK